MDGAEIDATTGVAIKHFKNGAYNKDYTRAFKSGTITGFLNAPDEDAPWSEEDNDVVHLTDANFDSSIHSLRMPVITRVCYIAVAKKRPMIVMFYAPVCHRPPI